MGRITLLCFSLLLPCFGAVTFAPASCAQTIQQYGPHPLPCKFVLTGTGTVTLQRATFSPAWHWWNEAGTDITSIAVSGSATIYLACYACNNLSAGTYTPDTDPAEIDGTEVPTTLIVKKTWTPLYSNHARLTEADLSGCSTTGTVFRGWKDTCTLTTQALGGYTPPAKGSSYADQIFGTPITLIAKFWNDYAVINEFNAPGGSDRYVITANSSDDPLGNSVTGETGIYSLTSMSKVYKTPCEQIPFCSGAQFSNIYPDRLYVIAQSGTRQLTLGGSAPNLTDDGIIYSAPDGNVSDAGGSSTLTREDYLVTYEFTTSTATVSSGSVTTADPLVNMDAGKIVTLSGCGNGLNNAWVIQTRTDSTHFTISSSLSASCSFIQLWDKIAVIDLANAGATILRVGFETLPNQPIYPRTIHISDRDAQTGKWYVINENDYNFTNQPVLAATVLSFRPGDTSLTFEYMGPLNRGTPNTDTGICTAAQALQQHCFASSHSTELLVNGFPWFLHQDNTQEGGGEDFVSAIAAQRLAAFPLLTVASGLLGGGYAYWNLALDHMGGARLAPFIASNGDNSSSPIGSVGIASYSGNEATTNAVHGLLVNDTVIISVADASTTDQTLSGSYNVDTVPSTTKFTTTKTPSSYQAASALAYKAGNDANINNGYNQVNVCRVLPDGRLLQCRRIAMTLSSIFSNSTYTADGYRDQPHVMLSPDAMWVGWTSNLMRGNRDYMYVAPTGFSGALDPDQFTPGTRVMIEPSSTSALFHATVPESQNYTIDISMEPGIPSPTSNTVSGRQLATVGLNVTGLVASTTYYWVAYSADAYYAAAGSFTTTSAPSGSAVVSFTSRTPTGASSAVLNYGTTSALGSSTSSFSCTAGQPCTVSVSATRGTVLYGQVDFNVGYSTAVESRVVR